LSIADQVTQTFRGREGLNGFTICNLSTHNFGNKNTSMSTVDPQYSTLSTIIDAQARLIDNLSIILVVITILLGLFTIAAPIALYFLSVKPARKAINSIDDRLRDYLIKERNSEIDQAIKSLKSEDHSQISTALASLSIIGGQALKRSHLLEIAFILHSGQLSSVYYVQLLFLISFEKNDVADRVYLDASILKLQEVRSPLSQYLLRASIDENADLIQAYFEANDAVSSPMNHLVALLYQYDTNKVIELFSSQEIIKRLEDISYVHLIYSNDLLRLQGRRELYAQISGTPLFLKLLEMNRKFMEEEDKKAGM
jgi:hypothetical protein